MADKTEAAEAVLNGLFDKAAKTRTEGGRDTVHDFWARTDDPAALRAAADAYGADYAVETNDEGDIEVGHTAFLYAVDSAGQIRLTWPFGTPHEDLTSDMEYLFNEGV